jgi:hypothetical protein
MSLNFFHGELGFAAELAKQTPTVLLPDRPAVVAVVGFIFRQLLESVAGEVEAGVAAVTVEHLIRVIVEAAEAYFTIRLEKFQVRVVFALGRFD